jgi:amino-acid N-acetyltransferase
MDDSIRIRRARPADLRLIKQLIALYPDILFQTHLPHANEFFVAVTKSGRHSRIIGCCALEVYSRRLAEVRSLVVSPDWQGRGIASSLVERCLREARRRKIHECLTITGATKLFEKHGFHPFKGEKYALLLFF